MRHKEALDRYQVLDECLRNPGKNFYIEDLMEAIQVKLTDERRKGFSVSKKLIYEDLNNVSQMIADKDPGVEILRIRDGQRVFYRYSNLAFSLFNEPFNELEIHQLKSVLSLLSQFKGWPQSEWIEEIINKLEEKFRFKSGADGIISFQSNEYLQGIDHLSILFNAILYKKVLRISYRSFNPGKLTRQVIHPYYLKQYNNRWFLFGQNTAKNRLEHMSLDRIVKTEECSDIKYIPNETIDFSEYFEDIIGTTRFQGEPLEISLRFSSGRAPYVLTKPLHGSQKISKDKDGSTIVRIVVIPNNELDSLVLSFGKDVEVLTPLSYREHILSNLKSAVNTYSS